MENNNDYRDITCTTCAGKGTIRKRVSCPFCNAEDDKYDPKPKRSPAGHLYHNSLMGFPFGSAACWKD